MKDKATFDILIENGKVSYEDPMMKQVWKGSIQYLPPNPDEKRRILFSRNKIPSWFLGLIEISPEDYADYLKCKNDEQLKLFVLMDALKHGCTFTKETKE